MYLGGWPGTLCQVNSNLPDYLNEFYHVATGVPNLRLTGEIQPTACFCIVQNEASFFCIFKGLNETQQNTSENLRQRPYAGASISAEPKILTIRLFPSHLPKKKSEPLIYSIEQGSVHQAQDQIQPSACFCEQFYWDTVFPFIMYCLRLFSHNSRLSSCNRDLIACKV